MPKSLHQQHSGHPKFGEYPSQPATCRLLVSDSYITQSQYQDSPIEQRFGTWVCSSPTKKETLEAQSQSLTSLNLFSTGLHQPSQEQLEQWQVTPSGNRQENDITLSDITI